MYQNGQLIIFQTIRTAICEIVTKCNVLFRIHRHKFHFHHFLWWSSQNQFVCNPLNCESGSIESGKCRIGRRSGRMGGLKNRTVGRLVSSVGRASAHVSPRLRPSSGGPGFESGLWSFPHVISLSPPFQHSIHCPINKYLKITPKKITLKNRTVTRRPVFMSRVKVKVDLFVT